MNTSLIFGTEEALQIAGANFPTFGKKFFLPALFSAGAAVLENFLFVVEEHTASSRVKAKADGTSSSPSGAGGAASGSTASPVSGPINSKKSPQTGQEEKTRLDQYAHHLLWVTGLRVNELEVRAVYDRVRTMACFGELRIDVHCVLLSDTHLDGVPGSFDCDMMLLVLPVGSGNRCDVERGFGEMLAKLPKWIEDRVFLVVPRRPNNPTVESLKASLLEFPIVQNMFLIQRQYRGGPLDRVQVVESDANFVEEEGVGREIKTWSTEMAKTFVSLEVQISSGLTSRPSPLKVRRRDGDWQVVFMQEFEERTLSLRYIGNARTIHIDRKIMIEDIEEKKTKTFGLSKPQATLLSNFIQSKFQKSRT